MTYAAIFSFAFDFSKVKTPFFESTTMGPWGELPLRIAFESGVLDLLLDRRASRARAYTGSTPGELGHRGVGDLDAHLHRLDAASRALELHLRDRGDVLLVERVNNISSMR